MKRWQIHLRGDVQGVGLRPYVQRLAQQLMLTGWVRNDAAGVEIVIQGTRTDTFIQQLPTQLPPQAKLEQFKQSELPLVEQESAFMIKPSTRHAVHAKITADTTLCKQCLAELFDRNSRYYHYPFINCTDCGPRYSITQQLPFDRKHTTMAKFNLCRACQSAYSNPANRRFHAQAQACPDCGPRLSHTIDDMAAALTAGHIIALKSLGGYQLIADANNPTTLQRLRHYKQRPSKPFAVMVLNSRCAQHLVHCSVAADRLLTSPERPIVILPRRPNTLPAEIAPQLATLGVMLPYTATHYLLFHALLGKPTDPHWLDQLNCVALVVTSANDQGSPLITDNEHAHTALADSSDMIVSYDRDIVTGVDDSVTRIIADQPVFIRRARGYTPRSIALPYAIPTTLALGGYLKNTVCITRGNEAFISQHIGELNHPATRRRYHETIQHLLKLLNVQPECIAHDNHPDFYSTQFAHSLSLPRHGVQHHHAHLAACAVEHGLTTPALGLALDGFGLGPDQAHWGGELLHYQTCDFQPVAALHPLRQPGGDIAARQPWRMAASVLFALNQPADIQQRFAHQPLAPALIDMLTKQINSPLTRSCGRWFDAASALLGLGDTSHYEGEAALRLESQVTTPTVATDGWIIQNQQLNLLPLFHQLLTCDAVSGANLFHGTLVAALVEWIRYYAEQYRTPYVLLSGGCFLNQRLSEELMQQLSTTTLQPLYPKHCPPNDGGISLGQAWVAGNRQREALSCV